MGVQSDVQTSVDNTYLYYGNADIFENCVGWCKSAFAQVGDTHLPGATPFLHLAGWTQVHQPLQPLSLANDFQVQGVNTSVKLCWHMQPLFRAFSTSYHINTNSAFNVFDLCTSCASYTHFHLMPGLNSALS